MKAFLLLALFPLAAVAQTTGYTFTIPWEGSVLYCTIAPVSGSESCSDVNYWAHQQPAAQTTAPADPQPFVAWNTRESHTGGGGAIELALLLSVMGIARGRRHPPAA